MLKIYNSLSRTKEEFVPVEPNKVSIYVCGATVYNEIHIGNARPIVFFNVVRNYLSFLGYQVLFVSNITDIDDKIIKKAKELNTSEVKIAEKYTERLLDITRKINIKLPDIMPKATDFMSNIIDYIALLIEKGYAYQNDSGIYFRVSKVSDYGILSNQKLEELEESVRIQVKEDKENSKDFVLWKKVNDGLVFDAPFGKGRPGWHTECSVMNNEIFGKEIDIHGGGIDLKFPHHENEIAQTKAFSQRNLSKYFMHVGLINMDHSKMSKSKGNVLFLSDFIKEYDPLVYKLLILSNNYRQSVNFSHDLIMQFTKDCDKIIKNTKRLVFISEVFKEVNSGLDNYYLNMFKEAMEDDFNTPNALSVLYQLLKDANKEKEIIRLKSLVNTLLIILDILTIKPVIVVGEEDILNYKFWQEAREKKDYLNADKYRKILVSKGWL